MPRDASDSPSLPFDAQGFPGQPVRFVNMPIIRRTTARIWVQVPQRNPQNENILYKDDNVGCIPVRTLMVKSIRIVRS